MPDRYVTVREFVEEILRGELTIERAKAYADALTAPIDEYSLKKRDPSSGYNDRVALDIVKLRGYLRTGLPALMDRLKGRGMDPRADFGAFVRNNISSETLSFRIRVRL